MELEAAFDAVAQITDQELWDKTMDKIRREFQDSGLLVELGEDFQDLREIALFEASEILNFGLTADRSCWSCFISADEADIEEQLKDVSDKLCEDPWDWSFMQQQDVLRANLKSLRELPPPLRRAVELHKEESAGDSNEGRLYEPMLFEFAIDGYPCLPRYARHFRRFCSNVMALHGPAKWVVAKVFLILTDAFSQNAFVDTSSASLGKLHEDAATWDVGCCDYPWRAGIDVDSARRFYGAARTSLLEAKVPPVMLVILAAQSRGLCLPPLVNSKIFSYLARS